jgi:hypothetical protein
MKIFKSRELLEVLGKLEMQIVLLRENLKDDCTNIRALAAQVHTAAAVLDAMGRMRPAAGDDSDPLHLPIEHASSRLSDLLGEMEAFLASIGGDALDAEFVSD